MKNAAGDSPIASPDARALPRLLAGVDADGGPVGIGEHLDRWGPLEVGRLRRDLLQHVEASGLVGHGGAWFPVAAKWRSVAEVRRRPIVVANGSESEPASSKDAVLLARVPHLVLDGAVAASVALGASRLIIYTQPHLVQAMDTAVARRRGSALDPLEIDVVSAPEAFVAGQETAVVNALNGHGAKPMFVGLRSIRERGVAGRPTLVHNVETLAHIALIARFGAAWFRALGVERAPGTMLLTVRGLPGGDKVIEAPLGAPIRDVLGLPARAVDGYRGALLGGYGGSWVTMDTLLGLELTERSARQHHTTLGPGVIVLLPRTVCPLAEVAKVVRYMAGESAGQCGPCVNGLAALADAVDALAFAPKRLGRTIDPVTAVSDLVDGRGACRHPDGVARFVRSACKVFSDEVAAHLRRGPCPQMGTQSVLPLPAGRVVDRTPPRMVDRTPIRSAR
jgi:NADH:ubiquinone oxidoreductase subunit F (NADH-binding)